MYICSMLPLTILKYIAGEHQTKIFGEDSFSMEVELDEAAGLNGKDASAIALFPSFNSSTEES